MAGCTLPLSPGPAVRAGGGILCRRFFVFRLSENRMPHSRMGGEGMLRVSRREGGVKQKTRRIAPTSCFQCPGQDSNLHELMFTTPLKVACLPISPPGRHCRISHFGCANIELIFEIAKFSTDLCRKKDFSGGIRRGGFCRAHSGAPRQPSGAPARRCRRRYQYRCRCRCRAAPPPPKRRDRSPVVGERSRSVCAGACHLASGSRTVPPQRTKSISRKR